MSRFIYTMKKYVACIGATVFMIVCCSLYLMLEITSNTPSPSSVFKELSQKHLDDIQAQVELLKQKKGENHEILNQIQDNIKKLENGNKAAVDEDTMFRLNASLYRKNSLHQSSEIQVGPKSAVTLTDQMCSFSSKQVSAADIEMDLIYEKIAFDNPDGGVWKQGFAINYDVTKWTQSRKLKVFVVPHSHNDPGWIKTFDSYYHDQTRHILDFMVEYLEKFPKLKFIYAEMSFFSLWWSNIDRYKRDIVRKLAKEGRLEIVTGGWVMTDEANAHFYAMTDQLIEGNLWLKDNVGVVPASGWAIDPFGHSPTVAYLLHKSKIDNMLIQRTHYSVKKELAKHKNLEFMWRQTWDDTGSTDILCHMMPFYSYDVPHTCGPDPSVCCQFDFKRLRGGRINCPWKIPPAEITSSNVAERSKKLLDQYRKKAQLYQMDVVLAPLGDDFRWDTSMEWEAQHDNYLKIMDYLNQQQDLNVEIQFGTLTDYFNAVKERMSSGSSKLPSLRGDFFTYADRDDHYWSGYFTSRPFYKRLDRIMEDHLRAAEIIYTLALARSRRTQDSFAGEALQSLLVVARRNLGLYQHHDGITGTAKDFVVEDYGRRLLTGLENCKTVMRQSASYLMIKDHVTTQTQSVFDVDESMANFNALPSKTLIIITPKPRPVVFFNSLAHNRTVMVHLLVDRSELQVKDPHGEAVISQISPYWTTTSNISSIKFKLSFQVTVPALGLSTYTVQERTGNKLNYKAKITVVNAVQNHAYVKSKVFEVNEHMSEDEVGIENSEMKVEFSPKTGFSTLVRMKRDNDAVRMQTQFMTYGTTPNRDRSGAYLFMPDGPAQEIQSSYPLMRVVRGPLHSEVKTLINLVEHTVGVVESQGADGLGIDIMNQVDIRAQSNKEIIMRLVTAVQNEDRVFYTDLNGFQMQRRQTKDKLPLQGNYYPLPTMFYLEDPFYRLNLLTGQSLGAASLDQGCVEIVQDRRLNQDDNRGLGQGVLDNVKIRNHFRVLIEHKPTQADTTEKKPSSYPSLIAKSLSHDLIYPIHALPPLATEDDSQQLLAEYAPTPTGFPCDLHLVNLRTALQNYSDSSHSTPSERSLVILQRLGVDCRFQAQGLHCDNSQPHLAQLIQNYKLVDARKTSLNAMHTEESISDSTQIKLNPMELETYSVILK